MIDLNYYIRIEAEIGGKVVHNEQVSTCQVDFRVRMVSNLVRTKAGKKKWAVFVVRRSRTWGKRANRALSDKIDKIIARRELVLPRASPSGQRR